MLYRWLRPLLFAADAELIHESMLELLATIQDDHRLVGWIRNRYSFQHPSLRVNVFGIEFANPIGLAAGFDKNAVAARVLAALGFGFVEIGTVTPRPQPGNPRPRLFRLAEDGALINRLGFNNDGTERIAGRLERLGKLSVPLGINIGKNFDTGNDRAADDYCLGLSRLYRYADYFVVNVSSPNTPGLRKLQQAETLNQLLQRLQSENQKQASREKIPPKPVLLKVAPDLSLAELEEILTVARAQQVAGIIATNTTIGRPALASPHATEAGGLSGKPLRDLSTRIIAAIYRFTGGQIPIIGVGGVFDGDDAFDKICAGASLVQVYTGFVYGGPGLPQRLNKQLAARLQEAGYDNVAAAVGTAAGHWPPPGED